MKNKVTIKDIAKESGVSVATVSYILNERKDQKISEATRKKVLQIVNLLGYTRSPVARSLATGKTGNIAIYTCFSSFALKQAEQKLFLDYLTKVLEAHHYHLLYLSPEHTGRIDIADAIICLGTPNDFFHTVAVNNFIPILMVDGMINDPLFYQLNNDFSYLAASTREMYGNEGPLFVCYDYENIQLKEYIASLFPNVCFAGSFTDFDFIGANESRLIVTPYLYLYDYCKIHFPTVHLEAFSYQYKAERLMEYINLSINRVAIDCHNILVR